MWAISDAAEAILLGFQHYLVMLGTTVLIPTALVPQMGGGNVRPDKEFHILLLISIRNVTFLKVPSVMIYHIFDLLG